MSETENRKLLKEAADIYLRYRQNPGNTDLLRERDRFIARGAAEEHAWEQVKDAWRVMGAKRKPKPLLSILIAAFLILAGYLSIEPLRILIVADHIAGNEPASVTLSSGDLVTLDAGTALTDKTADSVRHVELLRGAGYFDVETAERPFTVEAGGIRVDVLGTAFEVARTGDLVQVSVFEGRVAITHEVDRIEIGAGEMVAWSGETHSIEDVLIQDIAPWRERRLVADGLTFGQVVAILDRRISGRIVITGRALATSTVTGTFDLERPLVSLRNLAASQSAIVLNAPGLGAVVVARP